MTAFIIRADIGGLPSTGADGVENSSSSDPPVLAPDSLDELPLRVRALGVVVPLEQLLVIAIGSN